MTAPYRLRDGIGDWQAMSAFLAMILCAAALGLFPSVVDDYGALTLAYVAFFTVLLLVNMNTTDRRLREVSGS
ncbi:hypothetical protein [Halorubrum tebenquichense]|uniref:Uncharacterized protein n=1 Tax=Halorubrum tebenquichense DSM 14210 TaxID=1227485 RepID=M0DTQ5_9EURY|nr:hypothetical protein [Halorubrum tebenquichense]ELZ38885.1 hypothetical protein C472_05713 [Halorubrum tebenquichense DSM 14210]